MKRFFLFSLPLTLAGILIVSIISQQTSICKEPMPANQPAKLPEIPQGHEIATFAAGCYWCTEAIFQRLDGVDFVMSGFMGGSIKNPSYEEVCSGTTGHAEVVQVVFDPSKISFDTLCSWFWRVHNPTELNRQGADVGTQYRSAIFYHSEKQKKQAIASRNTAQKSFSRPIVTEISPATTFYPASISHQDYYKINGKKNFYCQRVIAPKLKKLHLDKK